MLAGQRGEATALAMRILLEMARVWEAERLIDVTSAHIDSCLYHGPAGLDFAELLLAGGAHVRGPDHAQRLVARSAPSGARPARRRDVRAGAEADGRLRRHGLPAHVDVRPVPTRTAPGVRRAHRVGRIERDRVRELGAGRTHEPLRRLHRHLRGDHRPRAGSRPASRRASARQRRVPAVRTTCRSACCTTRSRPRASDTSWGCAPARTCPSSSGSPSTRTRIG